MPTLTLTDALRLAINAMRDIAESRKMPSGIEVDEAMAQMHAEAADTLQVSLEGFEAAER